MQIPKLARGGVINNFFSAVWEKEEIIFPLHDKYYKIYHKTKSKRIKKKQMKKSLLLSAEFFMKQQLKNVGISNILIDGKNIC